LLLIEGLLFENLFCSLGALIGGGFGTDTGGVFFFCVHP
jgi:hypothetical protein